VSEDLLMQLIVIDDSSNETETVINMLRNAGHAVRTTRVEDDEDLRDAIEAGQGNMILSKLEIPYFSAREALHVVEMSKRDVPLLVLVNESNPPRETELLKAGAKDVVTMGQPHRLEHALLRELSALNDRLHLAQCRVRLDEASARAQSLVNTSRDAISYVSEGMHIYANESYLQMFGYTDMDEIEGMPIMDLVSGEDAGKFKEFLRRYQKGDSRDSSLDVLGARFDGSNFKITMEFSPATFEGEPCTQIIIRDQSVSKELEKKLDDLSKQDLLTGAYNRQFFLDALNQTISKTHRSGCLLYVVVDDYRQVRENAGIAGSDLVLADVAALLKKHTLSDEDFVARLESHIFTIMLYDVDGVTGMAEAEKILRQVEDHIFDIGGQTITTTCSIGVGMFNNTIQDPQEVLSRSERACNKAVEAGGNKAQIYNPAKEEMHEKEQEAVIVERIKNALREGLFTLNYLPIVSLQGDTDENYEVLLTSLEADDDFKPEVFLPVAERRGLMVAVDRWVLANAAKRLAQERQAGRRINFYINLSATSLKEPKTLPWLRDLIKATRIPANALTLQVSETDANSNLKAIKILSTGLKQLRIRLALDHFGVLPNYGNLLKHVECDILKIDGSLVNDIASNESSNLRVQEIAETARTMNRITIAESIADAQTLPVIWTMGIAYIQGEFLAPQLDDLTYDFSSMG